MPNYDVFISHSSGDRKWVEQFAESLESQGVNVWSESKIRGGEDWRKSLEEGLRQSHTFVIVFDEASLSSSAAFELGAAIADNKRIVSIVPDDVDATALPVQLKNWQLLRKDSPEEAAREVAEVGPAQKGTS